MAIEMAEFAVNAEVDDAVTPGCDVSKVVVEEEEEEEVVVVVAMVVIVVVAAAAVVVEDEAMVIMNNRPIDSQYSRFHRL